MKQIIMLTFGALTGVLSYLSGLSFSDNPVKYAVINITIIFIFSIVLEICWSYKGGK